MAVPLTRNAFAENRPDLFVVISKRSENVLFSFFLHKTTKRYSFRKISAVLSVILRLQKRGTKFLGNDLSFLLSFFFFLSFSLSSFLLFLFFHRPSATHDIYTIF